ncbi:phosphotransferase [Actinocorallia sp. A-T 12471]|uniref:phosphotransferase n=1 Tax=Actinocorallia sp. A-T 12471 TaxID=3089813 RepID=UPI0029CB0CDC|nr:phosphotransferase [Actinocorallia sp. A-T 12471]MDX6745082.1 phosphotransferase [Actinocorallia sp. A-T 12471]
MAKTSWHELPRGVRDAVQRELGGVAGVEMISEGLSSDVTFVAETGLGRLFVKGARLDDDLKARQLRREISINPYVTHLSPEIRLQVEEAEWLIVGFDYVEGRRADYSPLSPDIPLVLDLLGELSETPCPEIPLRDAGRLRESHARPEDLHRFSGDALAHTDLNPGNFRITSDGRAYLVDWARYSRGAPWIDATAFAMCLMTCGHTPYDAEGIMAALPVWKTLEPGDLDAVAYYQSAMRSAWQPRLDPWTNASVAAARRWFDYRVGLEVGL